MYIYTLHEFCAHPEFLFVATDFTLGSVFSLPNFGYSYKKGKACRIILKNPTIILATRLINCQNRAFSTLSLSLSLSLFNRARAEPERRAELESRGRTEAINAKCAAVY
jgi:hypothetical protein